MTANICNKHITYLSYKMLTVDSERLKQLLQFHEADPKDTFILFALAKEYETHSVLDKALFYYLKLKETDSNYIGLYYHLAALYEEIGQNQTAIEHYNQGIEIGKKAGDFHSVSELQNAKVNLEITMGN